MRNIELHIPFPSHAETDVDGARARNLDWMKAQGLLPTKESEDRYLSWRLAELSCRFHPTATGDDLDLGVDTHGFFFLFDDQFDGPIGEDPAKAEVVCREMVEVASDDATAPARARSPLARAWLDAWRRSVTGMSPGWRARARHDWKVYFMAYKAEARNRHRRAVPDLDRYIRGRREAIGVAPTLNLAERCGRFEVSPFLSTTRYIQEMRDISADVVTFANDLFSVDKEEAAGDFHNYILILMHHRRCTRQQAIEQLGRATRDRTRRFLQLGAQLDSFCSTLDVAEEQRRTARLFVRAAQACMRGNYDWSMVSRRYTEGVSRVPSGNGNGSAHAALLR